MVCLQKRDSLVFLRGFFYNGITTLPMFFSEVLSLTSIKAGVYVGLLVNLVILQRTIDITILCIVVVFTSYRHGKIHVSQK